MQDDSPHRSNEDRTAEMRVRLMNAARELFVAKGYVATTTPEIVSSARVTRGALYHHFEDKASILRAVLEREAAEVSAAINATDVLEGDELDALLTGASAYLVAMMLPGRTRLLLLDGPAVLGRSKMREIESRHGDDALRTGLDAAMSAGLLPRLPIGAISALLSAMFERAALDISDGQDAADYLTAVRAFVSGLAQLAPERAAVPGECDLS
ncbi:TetR/AcrR family transcriptional regulator [Tabrizicola piscis]|uniref:TetR/AcrR family transcriptional regulator n=1 Tax=Tabrizicola piscis TaxID=2494374 RepID=A0A3S8U2F7_9RHOB|nr:TetR/AcrR family transcriptional regulator [Tabrizicola piscis]AZL57767.1 TetR/AcrR family transcriptional regulator [Tabrizicola piscis]